MLQIKKRKNDCSISKRQKDYRKKRNLNIYFNIRNAIQEKNSIDASIEDEERVDLLEDLEVSILNSSSNNINKSDSEFKSTSESESDSEHSEVQSHLIESGHDSDSSESTNSSK